MNIGILNRDMQQKIAQAGVIERLNHGPPKPRQNRNADKERMNWQMRALQADTNRAKTFAEISFLSNESHCCRTSIEELKSIMLSEMKVPMIHTGRYLVCQCICKPLPIMGVGTSVNGDKYFTSGISMLIQDTNGDVEEVSIFNYLYEFANVEWMTSETIMIIKEPWLLYTSQGKIPSIKVDSPSDIIFVDSADERFLDKIGAKKWYFLKSCF
uniref:Uncharacterized protein n=1 Tax=Panagrolaimus davidi TaxID=227884 RepID=A0A914PDR8_9BILA